jgi:hypothetical protein
MRPASGSNAADDGEGLLFKGVLVSAATSLVTVRGPFMDE